MEEIFIPAVGMAMDNVVLLEWLKNPGDPVNAGDVIAIVETDKTTMEISADTSGILGAHKFNLNDEVPAGGTISVVLGAGESE